MEDIADKYFEVAMKTPRPAPKEYIAEMLKLWETIKENPVDVNNSYLIVHDIVKEALKANLLDVAEKWAEIGMQYEGIHNLCGEGAFQVGVVAFAKGDLEKAKQYFKMAKKNSGWRNFRNKNPAYRALIDKKKQ